ncbi:flavin-containing monooxygenase 5 [Ixodes scapularis]
MPALRVAVIGAGPSGLTAAKTCLESGLDPVVFEQSDDLGGLWYFDEKVCREGQPSVMRSTVINSSKELTAFSDFPAPAHFPNYMHHSMLLLYLRMYADHFGVTQRIRTRHAVRDVRPTKDHDRTGRWLVTVEDLSSSQTSRSVFDAVMVCVGHHAYPHRPPLPGLEHFRGRVQHTHAVKDCDRFKGRRLLVVGTGNSGMDVATEASLFAHKVYLSTRRGSWVLHRVAPNGFPMDTVIQRRYYAPLPMWLLNTLAERESQKLFNHDLLGLRPRHRLFQQHPTINDALANRILSGTLGEQEDTKLDDIVLATGYEIRFPFLSESLVRVEDNRLALFKYVFPVRLKRPETLSFLGYIQPLGAINPIAEVQARWVVQLLLGNVRLPTKEAMLEDIAQTESRQRRRYVSSPRHTIQVDYMPYTRDIARRIGADPSLGSLFLRHPALWWAAVAGPQVPYLYRLQVL